MFSYKRRSDDPYYDNPQRLRELLDGDAPYYLVDVRSREEYDSGHIRGASHVPYLEIGARPPTDDQSALIVVYCHSGGRSETAKRSLLRKGYTNVFNFGGIVHWPGELVGGKD